jgi:hypothetical protein
MDAAKTCSRTWKLPREASNPSMIESAFGPFGHDRKTDKKG